MSTTNFNPLEWLEPADENKSKKNNTHKSLVTAKVNHKNDAIQSSTLKEVEELVHNIESAGVDITANYEDWVCLGFAFAHEFGESGRGFFHRTSQYYAGYNSEECDKQYDHCLKSNGQGVTIKSFFHLAKENGIQIGKRSDGNDNSNNVDKNSIENIVKSETHIDQNENLPTFPAGVYENLPEFFKKVVTVASSDQEKDILLLGSITTLSACLPKLYSIYDKKKVHSNLYTFITAQASAGKGILSYSKHLVKPIHKLKRKESKDKKEIYQLDLADYNLNKSKNENLEKPIEPPDQMLFIPANNSATGAYQLLGDNDGSGLIFETEGDTLSQAFKSDYGNYSDGFRKAFHHETISYYRRQDREYVDIDRPCLSALLSGTPKQIPTLIPSAENGLLSRFIMYKMKVEPVWKDVFEGSTGVDYDAFLEGLAQDFFKLYEFLNDNDEIEFLYTADQKKRFNDFFRTIQTKYVNLNGLDVLATIRRLGLIATRLSMVLSSTRIMKSRDISSQLVCENRDFESVLSIIEVLVQHSISVYQDLPKEKTKPKLLNRKERFLNNLPKHFNRQKYLEIAKQLEIKEKTAEGYITSFVKDNLIHREKHDLYINLCHKEVEDSKDLKHI